MKKFKNLIAVALFFTAATVFGQVTVTGKVVDNTNQPLPGAGVVIKGTKIGTSTDFDGKFMINSKSDSGILIISFIGFQTKEVTFSASKTNLGNIQLAEDANTLDEIVLTATSFAIDRKTPVAVSTIRAAEIQEKLGTQEFPEILKSTPGVYATKTGGGYGDGRINLRGFSSQNIGVLINGVPVNDMENGAVYWSNWAGLGDVTSAMQVQRGLGASKVAVPSIGGTINIITKSTDAVEGGSVKMGTANDGYQKYGFTLSTGLMKNGLAVTVSAAKISGDGYVDGTEFKGVNYFLNIAKQINDKHKLSFTLFGAKQTHGQRYNRRTIAEYRETASGGKRFNPDWGYRNGQLEYASFNFYNKPQMSLNHYWTISDKTNLSTAIYASFGSGGGRRDQGAKVGNDNYRLGGVDQPIDFDKIAEENKAMGALGSSDILYDSKNAHQWYGLLSTLKTDLTEKLTFLGGLDARYYVGSHWYEVEDLLGGDFFVDTNSADNTYNKALKVGDRFDKDYKSTVKRAGIFAQLEYAYSDDLSMFISTALSNTTYSKVDYMRYAPTDPKRESDKANFLGYSTKAGANYNLNEHHNVFINIGHFSKAPFLTGNVFISDRSTDLNKKALNEKVTSFEVGYGYRSSKLTANINFYSTSWLDKSLTGSIPDPSPTANQGDRLYYNIPGLDALHQGLEIDFAYHLNDDIKVTGMASIGNWNWKNDAVGQARDASGNQIGAPIEVFAKGLKVTDAAQTTYALGLHYKLMPKTAFYVDFNYAGNLYAFYNITNRGDASNRKNSWKLPAYGLLDFGFNHGFKIGSFEAALNARMNNALDTDYISDANDGPTSSATDAQVYYGAGRTFSLGLKIKF